MYVEKMGKLLVIDDVQPVRTHYNTRNEYAQRLSQAYREQGKDRMDLY